MKNNNKFFKRFILLVLSFVISTTLTNVNYANEVDNKEVVGISIQVDLEDDNQFNGEEGLEEIDQDIEKETESQDVDVIQNDYDKKGNGTHIPYIYGNGTSNFSPSGNISRQEAFVLFLRAIEISETGGNPTSHPIQRVFKELENRDIKLHNYQKTELKDEITRGEIANLVDGYLRLPSLDKNVIANDISDSIYIKSIKNVLNNSIMNVDIKGNFNPHKKISRAEIITVLNRIQNRKASNSSINDIPQIYKDVPKTHWSYPQILAATVFHTVDVNTEEQKWTSHTLTESDKKKIKETKEYNDVANVLISKGIKKPNNKQLEAIRKMNNYIANNNQVRQDFENGKNLIFAFEGAGDYLDKWTKTSYHNEGRYGAMFIVVKNKKVSYITTNGSTLPDNPSKNININGVIKKVRTLDSQREGISYYKSGNHKSYPGLIPHNLGSGAENKSQNVKSLQGKASDGYKLNIHAGRSDEGLMSDGCLTIKDVDYLKFSKTVGYMPSWINDSNNNFDAIYKIGKGQFVPNVWATLILDRTLMEASTKSKFWIN